MDNYSTKDIEQYILLGFKPKKGFAVDKKLLFSGHCFSFVAIIVLIVFNLALLGDELVNLLFYNIGIILLVPIVVLLSIKFNHFGLRYNASKKFAQNKTSPYLGAFSALGGAVGIGFARFSFARISDSSVTIVMCLVVGLLALIFIFAGCIQYHQVYLIRKYCPHLKDRVGY